MAYFIRGFLELVDDIGRSFHEKKGFGFFSNEADFPYYGWIDNTSENWSNEVNGLFEILDETHDGDAFLRINRKDVLLDPKYVNDNVSDEVLELWTSEIIFDKEEFIALVNSTTTEGRNRDILQKIGDHLKAVNPADSGEVLDFIYEMRSNYLWQLEKIN